MFLGFFVGSLTGARHAGIAALAHHARVHATALLRTCALLVATQLGVAAALGLRQPALAEGALLSLYGAGYASLAVLAVSQAGRRLKGRVRMEIEEGEGERHSVMSQGGRLAARNYVLLITAVHLIIEAVAGFAAAGAAGASGGQPLPLAQAAVAAAYVAAGALKFAPGKEAAASV